MAKKLKENGLVEGSLIAYLSVIITKILGALYVIPFYAIIGEEGGYIYSSAYVLYNLVSNASTSGVPTAMSILIAEHNTKNLIATKQKVYRVGVAVVFGISLLIFLFIQIFAPWIAGFFMDTMQDGTIVNNASVSAGLRCMSLCLLFAPFLSVNRGYLQGHKYISPSSVSQVIEQVVRIAVVLIGAYFAVKVFNMGVASGANIALCGAAIAAAVALLYLQGPTNYLNRKAKRAITDEDVPETKTILFMILRYSIPVVIVTISGNLYELIDMKLVLKGMLSLGTNAETTQTIANTISSWSPKICMLIIALSMGLTTSLVPSMASSFAEKKYGEVNRKLVLCINTILVISVPIAFGLSLLADPMYTLFYSHSDIGTAVLSTACFVSVLTSIRIVMCMSLQSIGKSRLVCLVTVLGILVNTILDLPLLYLFNAIGLPAYLGTVLATAIGEISVIAVILFVLKKTMHFKYIAIASTIIRAIIPNIALIITVIILKLIIPIPTQQGFLLLIVLGIYALIGGGVYGIIAYKLNLIQAVFGKDFLSKILTKLHLKK